jgi:hypothetical protein
MQYHVEVKNERLQVVSDSIDQGTLPGKLVIGTAGMGKILASIDLESPPFEPPMNGIMQLAGVPLSDPDADAAGTPAAARFEDSEGVVIIFDLTVGLAGSGADIIVSNTPIPAGAEIIVESAIIAHA